MTPIQAMSLPRILEGKDIIGQAKTGSGKTAAFGLGLLAKLDVSHYHIQALVLCPTRELADQVAKEIRKLGRVIHNIKVLTLCGGTPSRPQVTSLAHGAHIIVGTPGRVEEHLRKGKLKLNSLTILVLDEADRMLDMGFRETLDAIIRHTPRKRQTLLFSATYPEQIQSMTKHIMTQPLVTSIPEAHDNESIRQSFYLVDRGTDRITALRLLLLESDHESTLVFCNTKRETQEVSKQLRKFEFSASALHGDLEQRERDQTLVQFANKSTSILVATDVASRGLDIDSVNAVINYHIAQDLEVHVHRIGRTGRAGSKGIACTLLTDKESYKFQALQEYLQQSLDSIPLPPLKLLDQPARKPAMVTLQVGGGKKQKVRPGDILGALTAGTPAKSSATRPISGTQVGKIHIYDNWAYVAVSHEVSATALKKLAEGKLKGRSFRVRMIQG